MGDPPQKSTKCKFIVNMYFIYNPYQLQKSFMYNVLSQIMLFYYFLCNMIHEANVVLINVRKFILLFLGFQHGNIKSQHFSLRVC